MKYHRTLVVIFLFFLTNCDQLPKRKLSQFSLKEIGYVVDNDSLKIKFSNPLNCPLRISANSLDKTIQDKLDDNFPVIIDAHKDTLLAYWTDKSKDEISISFSATMGSPKAPIHIKAVSLPFRKGNKYKIIQGYNGSFSHTSEYSKYALDFNLEEGDTICAVADGFVVGVIEGYTKGGKSKKWRDYANFITLFHPEMNLYTQYVHLMHNGSLVEVGDYVKSQQAIGLSGKTGQTDMEHLHLNVLKPNNSGMESVMVEFQEGYRGIDLKRGDWVQK